jgi:hypothetical protein
MTLKEIEQTLPNGFHDSDVSNLQIDYVNRQLRMEMAIWVGEMVKDDAEREKYRKAVLQIDNFFYCVIESPDERYEYAKSKPLWIDMGNPKNKPNLPTNIPQEAFVESFFVNQWNSFIHLAALNAKLTWAQ